MRYIELVATFVHCAAHERNRCPDCMSWSHDIQAFVSVLWSARSCLRRQNSAFAVNEFAQGHGVQAHFFVLRGISICGKGSSLLRCPDIISLFYFKIQRFVPKSSRSWIALRPSLLLLALGVFFASREFHLWATLRRPPLNDVNLNWY